MPDGPGPPGAGQGWAGARGGALWRQGHRGRQGRPGRTLVPLAVLGKPPSSTTGWAPAAPACVREAADATSLPV